MPICWRSPMRRRPAFASSVAMTMDSGSCRTTRRLFCPLSSDRATVNMFLCGRTFQSFGAEPTPTMTFAKRFDEGAVEVIEEA